MRANLSKFFVAMALSAGAMAAAHADSQQTVFMSPVGTTTTETGSFGDVITSVGAFTDDYIFEGAPPAGLLTFLASAGNNVSFTSVELSDGWGLDIPLTSSSLSSSTLSAIEANLGSGLYDLTIAGTAAVAGASYTGSISEAVGNTTSPVPEPHTWALMLAGLAATATGLRKRRSE